MPIPPLPDVPCVRVGLDYSASSGKFGSRFYLSYAGAPLTGDECSAWAEAIGGEWATSIGTEVGAEYRLDEVDVLDIASHDGLSGQSTTAHQATLTGTGLVPDSVCLNVEFGIARRYRGGKPRMYFPPGIPTDLLDPAHWTGAKVSGMNSAVASFFAAVIASAPTGHTPVKHVNLSFKMLGTPEAPEAGPREKTPEVYKPIATHDDITGYFTKSVVGMQRRRRLSTTY